MVERMAGWTIRAENLKALHQFEWSPSGVCALVGPNGSGKSSIVTALCLCLGGNLKSMNRQVGIRYLLAIEIYFAP